jgi:hypothetical protein
VISNVRNPFKVILSLSIEISSIFPDLGQGACGRQRDSGSRRSGLLAVQPAAVEDRAEDRHLHRQVQQHQGHGCHSADG